MLIRDPRSYYSFFFLKLWNVKRGDKDHGASTNNESSIDVQPPVVQVETQVPNSELVVAPVIEPVEVPVSALKPNPKPLIPYPSRLNDQKLREKANNQIEKFFQIFQDLHFDISFVDALILMPKFASTIKGLLSNKEKMFELARTPLNEHCSAVLLKKLPEKLGDPGKFLIPYSSNYDDISINRIDVIDVACEEYSQEVLGFFMSDNPTLSTEPIVSTSSPTLTPFGDSGFLLGETDAFLAIEDEPISPEINDSYYDLEGDILLLEEFLNDDTSSPPLPLQELKVVTFKFPSTLKIKKRPHLRVLMERSPTVACLSAYAMHRARSKGMLKRCEDTNLCLNWEKSHFMVKEGIVLGHKISKNGIEVDKAKVDVIAKLPHPTTVKGIRC
ncbi:hypothetical protein Tco_0664617 [Tanacetum coccineum]